MHFQQQANLLPLLEHGFVDAIAPRSGQRKLLAELLKLHKRGG